METKSGRLGGRKQTAENRDTPSLRSIAEAEARRLRAKQDLCNALRNYLRKLDGEGNRSTHRETEIFCTYARENYASRAQAYFEEVTPCDPVSLFEAGDLSEARPLCGLPTLGDVFDLAKSVKIVRPRNWPDPRRIYGEHATTEMRRAFRPLLIAKHVRFHLLLEEPENYWFIGQVRGCVRECVLKARQEYERRFFGLGLQDHAASFPELKASAWSDIEISFFNEHSIRIRVAARTNNYDFGPLGMADKRSGTPKGAWEILHQFALNEGVIRQARSDQTWPQIEKRVQELRPWLRRIFGLSDNPIPFVRGEGYRPRFAIRCERSYQH